MILCSTWTQKIWCSSLEYLICVVTGLLASTYFAYPLKYGLLMMLHVNFNSTSKPLCMLALSTAVPPSDSEARYERNPFATLCNEWAMAVVPSARSACIVVALVEYLTALTEFEIN